MGLQKYALRRLAAAAGFWMVAQSCAAAPQAPAVMPTGATALPPVGFVAFCLQRPSACGSDVLAVQRQALAAKAEREALLAPAVVAPASVGQAPAPATIPAADLVPLEPLVATVERAALETRVAFVDPAETARARASHVLAMTPDLWSKLNSINGKVNRALVQQADLAVYGREDVWALPMAEGRTAGDCEDFVLEKRRALLDAGLPAQALNIAIATTAWGETHAVLLVRTRQGEFVLDNLSPWVLPWTKVNYQWRQRQVEGEAFSWAMATNPRLPKGRALQLAAAR